MEKIKIEPNGVNLSLLHNLGESLTCLAKHLRQCYSNEEWRSTDVKTFRLIRNANFALSFLELPEMEIDLSFIEQARKKREQ